MQLTSLSIIPIFVDDHGPAVMTHSAQIAIFGHQLCNWIKSQPGLANRSLKLVSSYDVTKRSLAVGEKGARVSFHASNKQQAN